MTQIYINVYRKRKYCEKEVFVFESFEDACQDIIDTDKSEWGYLYTLTDKGKIEITRDDLCEVSPTYARMIASEEKAQQQIDEERGK